MSTYYYVSSYYYYICGAQGERPATNSTVCGRRQFQRTHITIHELYTLWQKSISTHTYYYPRTLQFVAEVNYNARLSLSTCPHTATCVVRRGGASDLELYIHVNATLPPRQRTQPTRPTKPLAIILANSRAESLNPPAITISGVTNSCVSSAALIHSRHPASSVCLCCCCFLSFFFHFSFGLAELTHVMPLTKALLSPLSYRICLCLVPTRIYISVLIHIYI